jgi:Protein of unknown function (DUF3592)
MGQIFFGLMYFIFWVLMVVSTIESYKVLRIGIRSKRWNKVEATITAHKIYTYSDRSSITRYGYSVVYTYNVNHQIYQGCVDLDILSDKIDIFYDPDKPEVSSLGWDIGDLIGFCVLVGFTSLITGPIMGWFVSLLGLKNFGVENAIVVFFLITGSLILQILFLSCCAYGVVHTFIFCYKELKHRRMPRPGMHFFICFVMFGVLSHSLMAGLAELVGLILIGSQPTEGCYQPNFQQKKWISTPCPPRLNGPN